MEKQKKIRISTKTKMYAIREKGTGMYLNYASKKKSWLTNKYIYYATHSPFPTLRPKDHIEKYFKIWIQETVNPKDYEIIEFIGGVHNGN